MTEDRDSYDIYLNWELRPGMMEKNYAEAQNNYILSHNLKTKPSIHWYGVHNQYSV